MPLFKINRLDLFLPHASAAFVRRISGMGNILGVSVGIIQSMAELLQHLEQPEFQSPSTAILLSLEYADKVYTDMPSLRASPSHRFITFADALKPIKESHDIWQVLGDPTESEVLFDFINMLKECHRPIFTPAQLGWGAAKHSFKSKTSSLATDIQKLTKKMLLGNRLPVLNFIYNIQKLTHTSAPQSTTEFSATFDGEILEFCAELDNTIATPATILEAFSNQTNTLISAEIKQNNQSSIKLRCRIYLSHSMKPTPALILTRVTNQAEFVVLTLDRPA